MRRDADVTGLMFQGDTPDWRPLLRIMDEELVGCFMWMFEIRTLANKPLHAYKHCDTRCYLHLDRQGRAYAYVPENSYRPLGLAVALEAVFSDWSRLGATVREARLARQAILRARQEAVIA